MTDQTVNQDLQKIVHGYRKLCGYCDLVWNKVKQSFPEEICCRKGCSACCELQSVNQLEAHLIRTHLQSLSLKVNNIYPNENRCPFLLEHSCSIYEARPLICRTHGLVLNSRESSLPLPSCPDNFKTFSIPELPGDCILDTDIVTGNLMRLNLAFCICTQKNPEERISLRHIIEAT